MPSRYIIALLAFSLFALSLSRSNAQIQVTLNANAAPGTAAPRQTNILVTGHGFPVGTIPPANVTVTLKPAAAGAGPSGVTKALAVTVVSGSTERITCRVPGNISVVTPTAYQVSITGTTSTGTAFQSSNSSALTIDPILAITTASPLPTGTAGAAYSQGLVATGGNGTYTWSVSAGSLPDGLGLNPATGQISGQPTGSGTGSFTIDVKDGINATASKTFTLTINPPAQILSVGPNSGNAGLSLQVTITGSFTNFVQGATQASFGPGISVGGSPEGQAGPVTVTSSTTATAQLSIDAAALTGSQTVTVTTGPEQPSLANGFTILPAIPFITIDTTKPAAIATGISGFADEYLLTGVEYNDPKYLGMVQGLKPGFIRYPAGLPSMVFDWQTGHENSTWITQLSSKVNITALAGFNKSAMLTQAKGGACFTPGTCFSDFGTFVNALGASGIVDFNGFTDTNANSAANMVTAARNNGVNIIEWELSNEPYVYPLIFPTATSYATAMNSPYYTNFASANPTGTIGVFYQGAFSFVGGNYQGWDTAMSAYSPRYWTGVSTHIYPITNARMTTSAEEETLNGILAHGTTEYISSYLAPAVGANTPIFITEMNSDAFATMAFEAYIYNGIFLAEYIARMSTAPNVKAVAVQPIYLGNTFNQGIIRAVNDYETYLAGKVKLNPNFSTNTATDPNTQFSFYYSTSALCLQVANQAINSSNAIWPTTVNGGPTVPIQGYDGQPIPAVFAQAYQGTDGTHYLLVTNKSGSSLQMGVEVNGSLLPGAVNVSSVSNPSDTASNTAASPTNVQVVSTTSSNPVAIGPYSVTRIQW
ncbi:MAG: Ig domain-containing protein [Bryobacteraceae bacterium]